MADDEAADEHPEVHDGPEGRDDTPGHDHAEDPVREAAERGSRRSRLHDKLGAFSVPLIVLSVLGLFTGALLLIACTPTTSTTPCLSTNGTCLPSGNCPYAPGGVVLLTLSVVIMVVGIVALVGPRPEGSEPHPEAPSRKPKPDTALTRMEDEARTREQERKDREP